VQDPVSHSVLAPVSPLRSRSCIIEGEAVACDDDGVRGVREEEEEDW
jgi:hypothetical protein